MSYRSGRIWYTAISQGTLANTDMGERKMKKQMKTLLKEGLGAIGDRADRKGCPLIFYQPKACKRGESRQKGIPEGKAAER